MDDTMNKEEVITIPKEDMAEYVRKLALQDSEIKITSHDENYVYKWDVINEAKFKDAEYAHDDLHLWFEDQTAISEKVADATHWQPAEYKNHKAKIWMSITWDLTIEGTVHVDIEVEDPIGRPPGY